MKRSLVTIAVLIPLALLAESASPPRYVALSLQDHGAIAAGRAAVDRHGIPFVEETLPLPEGGAARVEFHGRAKRIFFSGLTNSAERRPPVWPDPLHYSKLYFIGDELGRIRLAYADGSTQVFPLVVGESVWWGKLFFDNPEPFPTDARFRAALTAALRLFPAAPVADGTYLAVITPKPGPIQSITIEDAKAKDGVPLITGITVELADDSEIAGGAAFVREAPTPELETFVREKSLRSTDNDDRPSALRLEELRQSLYSSAENFHAPAAIETPTGYSGPRVYFHGGAAATVMASAFAANVQDMAVKITADGMYHTSTLHAPNWGRYIGFGTYRKDLGRYYDESWSRDLGRSLQELTELGYLSEARRCADYCLQMSRRWTEGSAELKINGQTLPAHWSRIINLPSLAQGPFENDGHGLIAVFLHKLWQRLPDRETWLRARWPDIKAAGDWILWQFDHPEISGATAVLHTTSECAAMNGFSVYADRVCLDALRGLAEMAGAVGDESTARAWRERAEKMRHAITTSYVVADAKYGRVWTLESAGWPHASSVLGPLILAADATGFAAEDDEPAWRPISAAAYQRLIDTYRPFGFYGQAMGYSQGFVMQSALLLDRMADATAMMNWTARQIYDPRVGSYIVPEACLIDPTGRFWHRLGDLGNGVQEAEIVKALRIAIGVDDTRPDRVQIFPRPPNDWDGISIEHYPVAFARNGKIDTASLSYQLSRSKNRMSLTIAADREIGELAIRLGPFKEQPPTPSVQIDHTQRDGVIEKSGDSWWIRFSAHVGLSPSTAETAGG